MIYAGDDGQFGQTTLTKPIEIDTSDPRGDDDVIITNTLHLVKDKPVIVNLTSRDVIHSFALPNMRVKQDVIPGLEIPVWFVPKMSTSEFRREMAKTMPISGDERRRAQYPPYRWIAMQDYPTADGVGHDCRGRTAVVDQGANSVVRSWYNGSLCCPGNGDQLCATLWWCALQHAAGLS